MRKCEIVESFIERENGEGDGAYDLFRAEGTPEEIGRAIAASLETSTLYHGRDLIDSIEDEGEELFLVLKIKFSKAEAAQ